MYVRCENPTRETGELQNAPGPYNFPLCTLVHCANIATPTFYQYKLLDLHVLSDLPVPATHCIPIAAQVLSVRQEPMKRVEQPCSQRLGSLCKGDLPLGVEGSYHAVVRFVHDSSTVLSWHFETERHFSGVWQF